MFDCILTQNKERSIHNTITPRLRCRKVEKGRKQFNHLRNMDTCQYSVGGGHLRRRRRIKSIWCSFIVNVKSLVCVGCTMHSVRRTPFFFQLYDTMYCQGDLIHCYSSFVVNLKWYTFQGSEVTVEYVVCNRYVYEISDRNVRNTFMVCT